MAIGGFLPQTTPTFTTTQSGRRASAALVSGMSARADSGDIDYHRLETTTEINSRTSTVRTSWGAIGLDVTTPESASFLASSQGLGLDVIGAASTKISKAEMNTGVTTSYGSSSLSFTGTSDASTSVGSLTGAYKGTGKAADATSLQITITQGGTIKSSLLGLGDTRVAFDVRDQTGEVVFSFNGNVSAGKTVSLGADIGLSLAFGEGELKVGHKASTTVAVTPITVDANARFNAAAGTRPQFEAVTAVTAGSFKVNTTVIQVYADDTINSVLDRINSSSAGVTAAASDDKVTLTSKTNSEQNIDVANDTSNFVKAVKLDGASTTKGNLRDDERLLKDTAVFRDVATGSFTINGTSIAVNKDQDTLAAVLDRINGSGAGVVASLNLTTSRIEIVSQTASEAVIAVGSDTTGLLGMARLSTGNTAVGNVRDDRQAIGAVASLAAVASGSFLVNGVAVAVDRTTDSLSSVIARINASGAGVTAAYDTAADRLTFTPDVAGATLSLDGDTTGLLAALKITSGTAATRANADGAFNAAGVNGPLLDPGHTVRAGSFTVNGTTIAVAADDTINTVLAKITASSAGVTATYDEATERVLLVASAGDAPVTLGADSSGFLAAVKLDHTAAASHTTTSFSSFDTALGEMAEYAGVTAGVLTVNGQDIAVDPMTTTLDDLVDALNGLSGVSATMNRSSGGIQIWSDAGRPLTLEDTSGVLDALGIDTGTVAGRKSKTASVTTQTGESRSSNAGDIAARVTTAVSELNAALADVPGSRLRNALEGATDRLRDQGVRGLAITEDDGTVAVSVASDALIDSLDGLGADVDIARALAPIMEALEAAVGAAAEWDASPSAAQNLPLDATSRAQLMADQAAGSLLFVRSSLQPQESETSRQSGIRAYEAQAT